MGVRMRHPGIEGEGEAPSIEVFETVWAGRGWELVPEGTPRPDELDSLAALRPAPPAVADLDMVPDPDEPSDPAAEKPPTRRRRAADAAATDAATDTED